MMAQHELWTLRERIDEGKRILPLHKLLDMLGYGHLTFRNPVRCPFHDDRSPSFSVFQGRNGIWLYFLLLNRKIESISDWVIS